MQAPSRLIITPLTVLITIFSATSQALAHESTDERLERFDRLQLELAKILEQVAMNPTAAREYTQQLAQLDAAAGQRDAAWSGLFWHTDIHEALDQAESEGKLVLSLRMLGRLDETLSCANSRFFRTFLYPDPAIRELLKQHYVLHWSSQREVPVVTIDYKNGVTHTRPITGNSIHYVLRSDGRVIDALPGMYAPKRFHAILDRASSADRSDDGILAHRESELARLTDDLGALPSESPEIIELDKRARAQAASHAAMLKARVEFAMLNQITIWHSPDQRPAEIAAAQSLAELFIDDATITHISRVIIASHLIYADVDSIPTSTLISTRRLIAEDTAINEMIMRPRVLSMLPEWEAKVRDPYDIINLAGGSASAPAADHVLRPQRLHVLAAMNDAIYTHLFLMPNRDPWVGMHDPSAYTALPNQESGTREWSNHKISASIASWSIRDED